MEKLSRRPNLLYVLADQLRLRSCGYAGDARAITPCIDRLASRGVSFVNAVSSTPVCAAYRASLFTGKHTTTTGMVINELRLSPAHECLGHVLTRGGYRTGYIGKWHLWANVLGHHDDVRNAFTPPGTYRLGFDGFWAAYNFHHVYYNAYYFGDEPRKIPYGGPTVYEPDAQTDMAIGFLRQAAERNDPFALFLSYGTPHDPWDWGNVPREYADRFREVSLPNPPNYKPDNDRYADGWAVFQRDERDHLEQWRRAYYAMTANLDWNLGRLLRALDEAARVPFLVRWPRAIPAGRVADACLGTPDLMPTLLGLAGLPVPRAVEGMDISHCALGTRGPEPEAALLQGTGTTAAWADGHEWRALRGKRYTYAVYRRDHSELLFDNQADPWQTNSLVGDAKHAEALDGLRKQLKRRMEELNDTFEACTWYRDHWTRDRNILRGARGGTHDIEVLSRIIADHLP